MVFLEHSKLNVLRLFVFNLNNFLCEVFNLNDFCWLLQASTG